MIKAFAAHEAKGELKPFEYEPESLKAHEVDIDVAYCGICHSDVSMLDNDWGFSQYPLVAGHEVVGKVKTVGKNVKNVKPGHYVGLGWHAGYCNHCEYCESGDQNLCKQAQGTIVGRHGGFATQVRADANSVVKIPEGVDLKAVGPLFCGGITVFNPLLQYNIQPTDKVAVIGIGGLGHMALQFLNAWGCEVTAFTSSDKKREEALSLGAHKTLNSRDAEDIKAAAGRFDLIISTVNVTLDWEAYLNTLKAKGRLHFVGATLEPLKISVFSLMGSQRSISSSPVGSPQGIATMLDFAKRHDVKATIETFAFKDINAAVARVREGKAHYRVVLEVNSNL